MEAHLGIDLGTSAVKVLVLDGSGAVLSRATRHYPTHVPGPGWAEQSPQDWWDATVQAVRDAIGKAGATVSSVGLSGQLNGFVLTGADGKPLTPAIIWLDVRATSQAEMLQRLEALDVAKATGNPVSPICVLPKLVWCLGNRPELIAATKHVLFAKDYILYMLTGERVTDPSDAASTALAVPNGTHWDERLVHLAGLTLSAMPAILPSAAVAGVVTNAAAAQTGLAPGIKVAAGAGDVASLALGCGVVRSDQVAITLGTAGHVVAQAAVDPGTGNRNGLWRIPHSIHGRMLWLGLIMSGGLSYAWLRRVLAMSDANEPNFEKLEALAAAVSPGSDGLVFLPFLEGAATPYSRPDARGAFVGLSSAHGAGHLLRAAMEGVAFNARECVNALETMGTKIGHIRIAEGGAQSPLWCQIMADALARPVLKLDERDTSAAGAAYLGWAAANGTDPGAVAEQALMPGKDYEPGERGVEALESQFNRYSEACRLLVARTGDSTPGAHIAAP
jgi:xylulokinase